MSGRMQVGHVSLLARYPVKSMGGELLAAAEVASRGVVGDRSWAAYTADGGIGSGKTTRRFQRVDGLLAFRARIEDTVPVVEFPDGRTHRADDPAAALSSGCGRHGCASCSASAPDTRHLGALCLRELPTTRAAARAGC